MGELENAHRHFIDALSVASRSEITPIILEALVGEARVRMEEGNPASALAIALRVCRQSSGFYVTHLRAEKLCSDLQQRLTASEVENAQEMYQTVEAVTQEVLGLSV